MMSSTTMKLSTVLVVAIGLMSNTIEATATFCPSTYQPTSYAPISVECPTDVQWIRPPTRLNPKEAEWVRGRKRVVADALDAYLERLCLEDFDTSRYIRALRRSYYAHVPTLGLAISGGGYRSGYTGTGAIRALDSRLEAAKEQRVGGLLQSLTYLSGLSGGSWPVVSLPSHNFPTVDEIVRIWLSQSDGSSNSSSPGSPESIFEDIAAKLKAGFNVSASDYLGRNSAYEFLSGLHGGVNNTWSGIARLSNFVNHQMPLPMLQASELADDDKEYFGLKVPYYNATSYEMTPFEIGSWTKGFTPTEWMGTRLDDGVPVNGSMCTLGFDSSSLMMGTTTSAVNFWIIENDSNGVLAPFPKRSINNLKRSTLLSQRDLSLFPNATLNGLLEGFKTIFGLSAAQVDHAIWPNPFASSSSGIPRDLSLVDSSEAGQVIPLWSQIQPERASSFIIAWDDNPDAEPYAWLNGTSIHNTYLAAKSSGLPFPIVPPPRTMLNKNFTLRPTFFGCNANLTTTGTTQSPIVLYMANAPYSAYTNYTWTQSVFSNTQMYEIFDNSFNAFTQGNGTLDHEWPACLGCAVVERSLEKLGMRRTKQCERCFKKHCWDGTYDEREPGILDPGLPLAPGLSFAEWNATIWN